MRADPAAGALIGIFLVFGLLMLPGSFILALIVLIVIGIAKRSQSPSKSKVDREFATRFQELENEILGATSAGNEARQLATKRARRSRGQRLT
jgi:uncharacterized membrane protein YphA (DoxX/SURF4 family)